MKVKNRSVCQNCRSRKLGCDGKYPECGQCLFTGRQCPGYPANWSFVHSRSETAQGRRTPSKIQHRSSHEISKDAPSSTNSASAISNEVHPHQSIRAHNTNRAEQVDLVIRSYVPEEELQPCSVLLNETRPRICGSWVEVLPDLIDSTGSDVVLASLDALATSIVSQRPAGGEPRVDGTLSYLTAIQIMRKELGTATNSLDRELLASIMCLGLTEVMFAGSAEGLTMHINAVARILQANGPERYQTGVLHKLFIGFRPVMMIKAIQDRAPSFLSSEEWQSIPFAVSIPSPMQSLLSQTATFPLLLLRMDRVFDPPVSIEDESEAVCLLNCFKGILNSLDEWESSVSSNATGALYWYQDQNTEASKVPAINSLCIWFSGITMANALTYIWAFRIICLYEIRRLAFSFPQPSFDHLKVLGDLHISSIPHKAQALMSQICQSMEYLLQDEMKLFGPASAVLPLQVAYVIATMDANRHHVELAVIRNVIDRLVRKGLQSFPFQVFEKNPFMHRWDTVK
ncbi:hypothetical protein BDW62DRAFT_214754 [Aspergillus aurantiobrunneus]